ncbi:unnamed protein product [Gordionus sp. m RMFG-2023]
MLNRTTSIISNGFLAHNMTATITSATQNLLHIITQRCQGLSCNERPRYYNSDSQYSFDKRNNAYIFKPMTSGLNQGELASKNTKLSILILICQTGQH